MIKPLFLLCCVEAGISIAKLDFLTIGRVVDMWTEKGNCEMKYRRVTTKEDSGVV